MKDDPGVACVPFTIRNVSGTSKWGAMGSTLTWLDLTANDRDRMRQVLDLFNEQGTVDEMGLGSLRDEMGDALFPGTSTLLTRLRYVLFIPWIYRRLEIRKVAASSVAARLKEAEVDLIWRLAASEDAAGVIGVRAGASLSRRPSSVYWGTLVHWGIFQHPQGQGWYHDHFARLAYGGEIEASADDPGVSQLRRPNWHRRLPEQPDDFPWTASFLLSRPEAEFLQGRLEERCAGTLLAWLAREGTDAPADGCFWDDSAATRAGPELRRLIELARRFSLHVEGMPLLYNMLLAERRYADDGEKVEPYRSELAEWAGRESEEEAFDPRKLWAFAASRRLRVPTRQRDFIDGWSARTAAIGALNVVDDDRLRTMIEFRERQLKGPRARLANPARLLDWNGYRVGVGRMDFRWHRVRQLVGDLHRGLAE